MTRRALMIGASGRRSMRAPETQFSGYDIRAKVTEYAGVKFRSQLEACWASFFDLTGIEWEYEPVRLQGWIPDFRLFGRFLCEVKPIEMTGFAVASQEYHWIRKAMTCGQAIIFGRAPSACLACMVSATEMSVSGRTVFYDPNAPFKMVSVSDDGGSHPLIGSAKSEWAMAYRNLTGRRSVTPGIHKRNEPEARA